MSKKADITKANAEGYEEGIRYALEYLSDLYEGLDETDLWADYMEVEGKK